MDTSDNTPNEFFALHSQNLHCADEGHLGYFLDKEDFLKFAASAATMQKANAAQVLAGYLWKPNVIAEFIDCIVFNNKTKTLEIDQTKLLPALLKFQQWLFEHQPKIVLGSVDKPTNEIS
jgi:hypothetical protein